MNNKSEKKENEEQTQCRRETFYAIISPTQTTNILIRRAMLRILTICTYAYTLHRPVLLFELLSVGYILSFLPCPLQAQLFFELQITDRTFSFEALLFSVAVHESNNE
jgi:hypothetical protein